jgi:serine/threonine protein kinase
MPNGSLEKYIFSSEKSFSWDKINEIAVGIARGIDYLHRECDMQILHFDIKPHNILLDSDFTPKIADFGLAKLYPRDNSFLPVSAARGTVGYIAPEMISRSFGSISSKYDVYSFGMLLLEMAGGRRNVDPQASRSQTYYPAWVYNQLSRQDVGEITEAVGISKVERKLCIIALWCIQMKSHDRPAMSEVLDMLEIYRLSRSSVGMSMPLLQISRNYPSQLHFQNKMSFLVLYQIVFSGHLAGLIQAILGGLDKLILEGLRL